MGIYCNVCLAFSETNSSFTDGFTKFSHMYERISEPEASKYHNSSVIALFDAQSKKDCVSKKGLEGHETEKLIESVPKSCHGQQACHPKCTSIHNGVH